MRRPFLALALAIAPITAACHPGAAAARQEEARPTPPIPLTGRIVDNADLLTPAAEETLAGKLERLEQSRGPKVVVVTVASLQGRSIEDFGMALGNGWGIGDAVRNDGVLLVVAPVEHKVRIEVGRGLERVLTNQDCAQIIDQDILPSFRKGQMQAGIEAGASRILSALDRPSQSQGTS
jgi:uncharacterized protein